MGRQSAGLHYQGSDCSDVAVFRDGQYYNGSQMYIGDRLIWERRPAKTIASYDRVVYTADGLGHFSRMQYGITVPEVEAAGQQSTDRKVTALTDFFGRFVCIHSVISERTNQEIIMASYSEDGYKWHVFHECGNEKPVMAAKHKIDGNEVLVLINRNELLFFDSGLHLIKTLSLGSQTASYAYGGERIYVHGTFAQGNEWMTVENGEIISFTTNEMFRLWADRIAYNRGDHSLCAYYMDYTSPHKLRFIVTKYNGSTYERKVYDNVFEEDIFASDGMSVVSSQNDAVTLCMKMKGQSYQYMLMEIVNGSIMRRRIMENVQLIGIFEAYGLVYVSFPYGDIGGQAFAFVKTEDLFEADFNGLSPVTTKPELDYSGFGYKETNSMKGIGCMACLGGREGGYDGA